MLKKLLVPLAGSQFSEAALPVARDIARRAGASICLAHVHIPNIAMVVGALEIVDEIQDAQRRDDECAYLEGITRRLAAEGGLKVGYTILDGPPGMVLADHAQATRSDLIVMTTHARSGLQRLWLGSVADELIRRSSVPILLLPSGHDGAGSVPDPLPEPLFKRIYIPLDGSALSCLVVPPALALGQLMHAECTLLRVVEPLTALGDAPSTYSMELVEEATDAQRCAAETDLERVAEDLRKATVSVSTRTIVAPDPASVILDEARLGGADLIAMTTHGWGGLKRWLVGSVTTNVLRHACTPLLVYRPPEVDTTCALAGPRHQASARVLQPASTAEGSGL